MITCASNSNRLPFRCVLRKYYNYYLLDINDGNLLVDNGWPGTMPKFLSVLKRKDISPDDIKYLLVTHFHPDHSGLTQELKNLSARLILLENQVDFTASMDELYEKKKLSYLSITPENNINLKFAESRKFLASLGLEGEIVLTKRTVEAIEDIGFVVDKKQ